MIITESELRELWRDGKHLLPPFPPGTTFSPAALDFLRAHNLTPQFNSSGQPDLPAPAKSPATAASNGQPHADWDKPGEFPVVLSGPIPTCSECGQPVRRKPEHMTQLDAGHFAAKTHPRIKLRGQLDTLHALVMLIAAEARQKNLPQLAAYLDTLAAYCREVQSAEYHNRPVGEFILAGKTAEEIHTISHHPDQYLNIAHIVPGPEDPAILHWLNYLRATARQVEITTLEVYPPPAREDLAEALNRFSSGVYYLELLLRANIIGWKNTPFAP